MHGERMRGNRTDVIRYLHSQRCSGHLARHIHPAQHQFIVVIGHRINTVGFVEDGINRRAVVVGVDDCERADVGAVGNFQIKTRRRAVGKCHARIGLHGERQR